MARSGSVEEARTHERCVSSLGLVVVKDVANSWYRFFPFYAVLLGWPLGAAALFNGRV
jgi:hypothetical protein